MNSYIGNKKGISQFSPSPGKPEKSLIYVKKVNLLARKYAILRKSILLPKSMPIIAKRFINAEKYRIIAKRFNYAELYQLAGHYTITPKGLEPINPSKKIVKVSSFEHKWNFHRNISLYYDNTDYFTYLFHFQIYIINKISNISSSMRIKLHRAFFIRQLRNSKKNLM